MRSLNEKIQSTMLAEALLFAKVLLNKAVGDLFVLV